MDINFNTHQPGRKRRKNKNKNIGYMYKGVSTKPNLLGDSRMIPSCFTAIDAS